MFQVFPSQGRCLLCQYNLWVFRNKYILWVCLWVLLVIDFEDGSFVIVIIRARTDVQQSLKLGSSTALLRSSMNRAMDATSHGKVVSMGNIPSTRCLSFLAFSNVYSKWYVIYKVAWRHLISFQSQWGGIRQPLWKIWSFCCCIRCWSFQSWRVGASDEVCAKTEGYNTYHCHSWLSCLVPLVVGFSVDSIPKSI